MRLTHHLLSRAVVSNPALVLCAFLHFGQCPIVNGQVGQPQVLDLTAGTLEWRSLGVPGNSASASGSRQLSDRLPAVPPLALTIESAEAESRTLASIRLRLVNRSRSIFYVASCTNELNAHGQGAVGRMTLEFNVTYFASDMKRLDSAVATVTYGALSAQDCVIPLAPGEEMIVIFRAPVPSRTSDALSAGTDVRVEASIRQLNLKDSSFSVASASSPARSAAARLHLR